MDLFFIRKQKAARNRWNAHVYEKYIYFILLNPTLPNFFTTLPKVFSFFIFRLSYSPYVYKQFKHTLMSPILLPKPMTASVQNSLSEYNVEYEIN